MSQSVRKKVICCICLITPCLPQLWVVWTEIAKVSWRRYLLTFATDAEVVPIATAPWKATGGWEGREGREVREKNEKVRVMWQQRDSYLRSWNIHFTPHNKPVCFLSQVETAVLKDCFPNDPCFFKLGLYYICTIRSQLDMNIRPRLIIVVVHSFGQHHLVLQFAFLVLHSNFFTFWGRRRV